MIEHTIYIYIFFLYEKSGKTNKKTSCRFKVFKPVKPNKYVS